MNFLHVPVAAEVRRNIGGSEARARPTDALIEG
jgi:hypothetical protein